jgi:hypothetical protein
VLTLALAGRAQVTASISGKVEDSAGMPIRGATVTVKSEETGLARTVMTDENGNYRVLSLPVGQQEVKAEATGFQSEVRTGINLTVAQEAVVNLRLQVGEVVQQITVSGDTPVVNTTTASGSGLVDEREVKDLPLNGRSFDNLITLNPGAVNFSALKSVDTSTTNGNTFTVEGRRTYENLFLWNGVEYTGSSQLGITPGGVSGYLLGIDAVREFNVLTDTYGAEYGKRAGAQVTIVTQSGSNALHGTLFEFLRNSDLDARNFFTQPGVGVSPYRQNQFGAALGGPIKKDKLFVFGNYEGFRLAEQATNVSVVPDLDAREGLLPNASGVYTPVSKLNPSMLNYMQLWPLPNGPELYANGVLPSGTALSYNSPPESIREDFGTLRLDYALGLKDSVSGSYLIDDGNSLIPASDPLFGSYTALRSQVASIEETHIVSPDTLNVFTAGFSRAGFGLNSVPFASFPASLDFVAGRGPGDITFNTTSTTGLSTITAAGPNQAAGVWNRRNLFTFTDGVEISKGIHQIKFGVWFQRVRDNEDSLSRQPGFSTFASLTTFLQGTPTMFQVGPDPNELGWRSLFGAGYVEDAMKLRPNLTLQLGLRYEFTTGWNEESGRAANYITDSSGVLETTPRIGSSAFTTNNATHLLGPRVGLAWDVFGNGKTAVRAGFGTYYSLIDDLAFQLNQVPPSNASVTYTSLPASPIVPNAPLLPSCGPGVPSPCNTYAPLGVQQNAQTPTVEEWRVGAEQELSRNTVLRVYYVGSFGYHGFVSIDPNSILGQTCGNPSGCLAGGTQYTAANCPTPASCTVPQGTLYIPGGPAFATSAVNLRPNPYLSAGFFWNTEGNTSYNALQVDVIQRLAHGLQFRGNYTWSKDLDMNSALTIAQANNQPQLIMDRNDVGRDWGPSALNIANQASASASYQLPFEKGRNGFGSGGGVSGKLLGGWQLNGILTLLTGFPFTPETGANRSGDGDTRNPDRPSLNPAFQGPVVLNNWYQWFNPNAFVLPPAGTYGNVGRGILTGPGLADLDLSLFKTTAVSERARLEFRAEFFNSLNHTNFGTPNATVFSGSTISASAGLITSTATTARQIQFGLKLIF